MTKRAMYFRMLSRSVMKRRGKLMLALGALVVGSSAAAALLSLSADVTRKMNTTLRSYGANLIVTPRAAGQLLDPSFTGHLQLLPDSRSIAGSAPVLYLSGSANSFTAMLAAVDFSRTKSVSPYWKIDGQWPSQESVSECLAGIRLARRLKVRPGDRVRLSAGHGIEQSFTVSGLVTTGDIEDEQAFISTAAAAAIAPKTSGASLVALSVIGGFSQVEKVAAQINREIASAEAKPLRQIAVSEGVLLSKIRLMMILLTAGILLASGLCVMSTMTAMVVERTKEIGLHKALGASSRKVLSLILGEALVMGIAGGLLGFALGMSYVQIIALRMFGTFVNPHAAVFFAVIGIAAVVALLGSVLPMKRALLVQPAVVLRGE